MKIYDEYRPSFYAWSPEKSLDNRMYFRREERWEERREERRIRESEPSCCGCSSHISPKTILLACGSRPEDANFDIEHGCVEEHQTFILDRVNVDTSCFCKPLVKIEFSSIVFFKACAIEKSCREELEVNLLFELVKDCGEREEVVQNWEYLKKFKVWEHMNDAKEEKHQPPELQNIELDISEPFTVTFCDKTCPGCCTYKMKVIGKKLRGEFEALRVTKPDLSAIAQESQC